MKSALLRLREAREAISPTEREIADYLLQHPEDVIDLSIHELAKRTFSSPSTIIRMCHRIGFEGFKEFRKAITYEMAIRRKLPAPTAWRTLLRKSPTKILCPWRIQRTFWIRKPWKNA